MYYMYRFIQKDAALNNAPTHGYVQHNIQQNTFWNCRPVLNTAREAFKYRLFYRTNTKRTPESSMHIPVLVPFFGPATQSPPEYFHAL